MKAIHKHKLTTVERRLENKERAETRGLVRRRHKHGRPKGR